MHYKLLRKFFEAGDKNLKILKKIAVVLLGIIISFGFSVNVNATIGNVDTFIYSDDFFPGDMNYVNTVLRSNCILSGKSAISSSRPTNVYALKSNFINSDCIYISTHGKSEGSELVLTQGNPSVSFKATDVPTNMSGNFAFLSACYSAKNDASGKNICAEIANNGYAVSVGFTTAIAVSHVRTFEQKMYQKLYEGQVYGAAFYYAKQSCENLYGVNANISTSARIYGTVTSSFSH